MKMRAKGKIRMKKRPQQGRNAREKAREKNSKIIQYSVVLLLFVTLSVALLLLSEYTGYTVFSSVFSSVLPSLFPSATPSAMIPTGFSPGPSPEPPKGEVYSLSTNPKEPLVLDNVIVNIGVRNAGDELDEYVLDVFISQDGHVKDNSTFTFSLQSGKGVVLSPTFTPAAVGMYKILTKLYDRYKTALYDTEILEINVISDIGPFDLSLDVLSRIVRPNDEVPMTVRMKNVGIKGTDVKIAVSMDCFEKEDMYKDFFVFVRGNGSADTSLTLTACEEEGLHHITAKLILFEHTFAESRNQIFINRTHYDFYVDAPTLIAIRQGESKVFDVYIKNTAEVTINNLRIIVEYVPIEWISIIPSAIITLKPNETAMFLVNLSIPKDASVIEYPIKIAIGSDETLIQKGSTLKVLSGELVRPKEGEEEIAGEIGLPFSEFQNQLIIFSAIGLVTLLLILVLRKVTGKGGRGVQQRKKEALSKAKDMIR